MQEIGLISPKALFSGGLFFITRDRMVTNWYNKWRTKRFIFFPTISQPFLSEKKERLEWPRFSHLFERPKVLSSAHLTTIPLLVANYPQIGLKCSSLFLRGTMREERNIPDLISFCWKKTVESELIFRKFLVLPPPGSIYYYARECSWYIDSEGKRSLLLNGNCLDSQLAPILTH